MLGVSSGVVPFSPVLLMVVKIIPVVRSKKIISMLFILPSLRALS